MRPRFRQQRHAWAVLVLGLGLGAACHAAPVTPVAPVPKTPPAAITGNRAPVAMAPKSGLPLPPGAELWVDSDGAPMLTIPGVATDAIRKVQVAVFHAAGDRLVWTDFTAFYAAQGLISPAVKPLEATFPPVLQGPLTEANGNLEEIKVFGTATPGDHLVLGSLHNLVSKTELGYVARISGKLNNAEAMVAGRYLVSQLVAQVRARRTSPVPPVPPGAMLVGPVVRVQGQQLQQLLQNITAGAQIPARVKQMAQVVLPQATAVVLSSFHLPAPMVDDDLVAFYTREAEKQSWGPPVSTDTSQPGNPTLLFQLPYNQGVAMIRAVTTAPAAAPARKSQAVYCLMIEGKVNVSALKPAPAPSPAEK